MGLKDREDMTEITDQAKILIVDDEDRVRKNMVRLMQARGFTVFSAASASEASRMIDDDLFDVVVTDMLMENDSAGLQVLKAAKEKDEMTEVIVLTAFGSITNAVDSTRMGAFDYIEKDAEDINTLLCDKVEASLCKELDLRGAFRSRTRTAVLEKEHPHYEAFDVLLIHSEADGQEVSFIASELRYRGLFPWFDKWHLLPGWIYLEEIERLLLISKAVAVFVGESEPPPWENLELTGFFTEVARRRVPIIPVLLADVPEIPSHPPFLQNVDWIDFRSAVPDPVDRFIDVITRQTDFAGK